MIKQLHVYAQKFEHSTAFLVGNAEGLNGLEDAIKEARKTGKADLSFCTYDGEEFTLRVMLFNGDEKFQLAKPYTEKVEENPGLWPGDIGKRP